MSCELWQSVAKYIVLVLWYVNYVLYTGSLLLVLMPGSAYLPLWYISVVSMWCICGVCWSEIDDFCHFCPLHCQSTEDDCEKKVGLSTALYLNLYRGWHFTASMIIWMTFTILMLHYDVKYLLLWYLRLRICCSNG